MRVTYALRLLLIAAVCVTAVAGATASTGVLAASAPAATNQPAAVTDGWTGVPGSGYATHSSACTVDLWASQVSAGDPAYIAANAFQGGAPYPCEAMVQVSSDGGVTWTSGTPVTLAASTTTIVTFSANTGAVYDGPGYLGRACAQASNSTLACTASISLGPGTGTPPDPALPAGTAMGYSEAGNGNSVRCGAYVYSSTSAKGSGTLVAGEFRAGQASSTASSLCEGWLETSADQGTTWQASLPVIFEAPTAAVTNDFTGMYPDGTGILARACTEAPTVSATPECSRTW